MDVSEVLIYLVAFVLLYSVVFLVLLYLKNWNKIKEGRKLSTNWEPVISILVPAYNEGKHLHKCLDSLLALDYPRNKLEIIVINDGSIDNTAKVVEEYSKNGVKLINKKNSGKAASLNYAIPKAKGELIATMDADSYATPDVIRKLLPSFEEKEVMAATPAVKVLSDSHIVKEIQRIEYLLILLSRRLFSFLDAVPVTTGPFSMFRAKVFKELGGFDEQTIVEDHEMALRIQKNNYKIRSSIDAVVYTEVPASLRGLVNQRVRWHRGGMHNLYKYREMISPKYGDFGMFVIPILCLAPVLALLIVLTLSVISFINQPLYFDKIGLDVLILSIKPLTGVLLLLFVVSMIWIYLSIRAFKGEKANFFSMVFYIFIYWYIAIAYNLITIVKELKREKLSW